MKTKNYCVCPAEYSGRTNNRFRLLLQNPGRVLSPHIKPGMTCLDLGCGQGFFTLEMADMVGDSGKVVAADCQEKMLDQVERKIKNTSVEKRILLHPCTPDKIGLETKADFILLFYMVHDIRDKDHFFNELSQILKPKGRILMAEPKLLVSKKAFDSYIEMAEKNSLIHAPGPGIFFSQTRILRHDDSIIGQTQ